MTKAELSRQSGFTRPTIDALLMKGATQDEILLKGQARLNPTLETVDDEHISFLEAQRQKEIALKDLRQLELATKLGELVPLEEVNNWVGGMILKARDILLRIAPELRDRLAQESDAIKVQEMIDSEVDRALRELSEYESVL